MPAHPTSLPSLALPARFRDCTFTLVRYNRSPHVLAHEVGRALGYAREGEALGESIRQWEERGELSSPRHVIRLEGAALDALRRLPTDPVGSRAPSLLLLSGLGFLRVMMLAKGKHALAFRDWAEEVLFDALFPRRGTLLDLHAARDALRIQQDNARLCAFLDRYLVFDAVGLSPPSLLLHADLHAAFARLAAPWGTRRLHHAMLGIGAQWWFDGKKGWWVGIGLIGEAAPGCPRFAIDTSSSSGG